MGITDRGKCAPHCFSMVFPAALSAWDCSAPGLTTSHPSISVQGSSSYTFPFTTGILPSFSNQFYFIFLRCADDLCSDGYLQLKFKTTGLYLTSSLLCLYFLHHWEQRFLRACRIIENLIITHFFYLLPTYNRLRVAITISPPIWLLKPLVFWFCALHYFPYLSCSISTLSENIVISYATLSLSLI